MDQLRRQLALQLLTRPKGWTDQRHLDVAASVLLMVGFDIDLADAASQAFDERKWRIDSKLISDFYAVCPKTLKPALVHSLAFRRLDPVTFKSLFRDAWRLRPMTEMQRQDIALSLESFLRRNPAEAGEYRDIILELLWSPREFLCLRGLYQVGYLDTLDPRDLQRIKKKLGSTNAGYRMNALNGLVQLVRRHREISPEVRAFCTSEELRKLAWHIQRRDPEKDARTCAHYLLQAIRAGPTGRRRRAG